MVDEKIYTIPLRDAFRKPKFSRASKAIRIIENFVIQHSKSENVKIGKHLNELIWSRGRKSPPRKVRVSIKKDDNLAYVELEGKEYQKFTVDEATSFKKENLLQRLGNKALQKQAEEELVEGGVKPTQEALKEQEEELLKEEKLGSIVKKEDDKSVEKDDQENKDEKENAVKSDNTDDKKKKDETVDKEKTVDKENINKNENKDTNSENVKKSAEKKE